MIDFTDHLDFHTRIVQQALEFENGEIHIDCVKCGIFSSCAKVKSLSTLFSWDAIIDSRFSPGANGIMLDGYWSENMMGLWSLAGKNPGV